jgi:hypothetical protein
VWSIDVQDRLEEPRTVGGRGGYDSDEAGDVGKASTAGELTRRSC